MIRLLVSVALALAVATSAEAMSPAPLHEPNSMITKVRKARQLACWDPSTAGHSALLLQIMQLPAYAGGWLRSTIYQTSSTCCQTSSICDCRERISNCTPWLPVRRMDLWSCCCTRNYRVLVQLAASDRPPRRSRSPRRRARSAGLQPL